MPLYFFSLKPNRPKHSNTLKDTQAITNSQGVLRAGGLSIIGARHAVPLAVLGEPRIERSAGLELHGRVPAAKDTRVRLAL